MNAIMGLTCVQTGSGFSGCQVNNSFRGMGLPSHPFAQRGAGSRGRCKRRSGPVRAEYRSDTADRWHAGTGQLVGNCQRGALKGRGLAPVGAAGGVLDVSANPGPAPITAPATAISPLMNRLRLLSPYVTEYLRDRYEGRDDSVSSMLRASYCFAPALLRLIFSCVTRRQICCGTEALTICGRCS
jgi:hypothetical protein